MTGDDQMSVDSLPAGRLSVVRGRVLRGLLIMGDFLNRGYFVDFCVTIYCVGKISCKLSGVRGCAIGLIILIINNKYSRIKKGRIKTGINSMKNPKSAGTVPPSP